MIPLPTKIPNRWWMPIIETTHVVREPVMTSKRLSLRCNAAILQNNGNCDIILSDGFTLKPDQAYEFGNADEMNVHVFDVQVKFLPATATGDPVVQELQIVEIMTHFRGSGFYIDQPAIVPAKVV